MTTAMKPAFIFCALTLALPLHAAYAVGDLNKCMLLFAGAAPPSLTLEAEAVRAELVRLKLLIEATQAANDTRKASALYERFQSAVREARRQMIDLRELEELIRKARADADSKSKSSEQPTPIRRVRAIDRRHLPWTYLTEWSDVHPHREDVAFHPREARVAVAPLKQDLVIYDLVTGEAIKTLQNVKRSLLEKISFSPDGSLIAATSNQKSLVRVWDARDGRAVFDLTGHDHHISAIAFSPDSERIATSSLDKTIRIWNSRTGELLHELKEHTGKVRDLLFDSRGSHLISVGDELKMKVWEPSTGTLIFELPLTAPPNHMELSASGDILAVTYHGAKIGIFDLSKAMPLQSFSAPRAALSPDGSRLVTYDQMQSAAQLVDPRTGLQIARLEGHEGGVHSAAFSHDGSLIVMATGEKRIIIWNASTGERVTEFEVPGGTDGGAVFSPDDRFVMTRAKGRAHLWTQLETP